ncbi:MAG: alpha/beta hydrolase [Alphaproteobacteria bacterium]|nr:alpha/beta hydrolase [Alphaproteobacteria bacterium]
MRRSLTLPDGEVSQLVWDGDGRDGQRPLLHFAHANGFNAGTYRGLLAPLAESFRVVASDARGHGFTRLPTTPGLATGWTVFRDDLIAVLERIAPQGAILAGHSMGATASLMTAALRPDLVHALVLVEPVFVPKHVTAGANELSLRAIKRRDTFASLEAALDTYRGRGAFKTWPDETIRDYLEGGLEPFEGGVRLTCRPAWEAEDFRSAPPGKSELAAEVKCPVTLIHADDGTASAGEVAIFERLYPATRVIAKAGATHFLPMEFPQVVRDEILKSRNARPAGPGSLPA